MSSGPASPWTPRLRSGPSTHRRCHWQRTPTNRLARQCGTRHRHPGQRAWCTRSRPASVSPTRSLTGFPMMTTTAPNRMPRLQPGRRRATRTRRGAKRCSSRDVTASTRPVRSIRYGAVATAIPLPWVARYTLPSLPAASDIPLIAIAA